MDPVNGFAARKTKANARSEIEIARQSNGVHPNETGYNQLGDMVFAWLKAIAP